MRKIKIQLLLTAVTFLFLGLSVACAASFDCKKAVTNVEKMICNVESPLRLGELDEEMLNTYRYALSVTKYPFRLKKTQKAWIKSRNLCITEMCLKQSYQLRIDELLKVTKHDEEKAYQEKLTGQNKKEFILNNPKLGFCKKIAELFAINELHYPIPADNSEIFKGIYDQYDIDLDGTNDKIIAEGGIAYSSLKVLLSSDKPYDSTQAHSTHLIEYNSKVYLINFSPWDGDSKSIMYFDGVDWLSPTELKTVCQYKDLQR